MAGLRLGCTHDKRFAKVEKNMVPLSVSAVRFLQRRVDRSGL